MALAGAILIGILIFWWTMREPQVVRELKELKRYIEALRMVGMDKEADKLDEILKSRAKEALKEELKKRTQ